MGSSDRWRWFKRFNQIPNVFTFYVMTREEVLKNTKPYREFKGAR
jgi:hypothetical protein